MFQTWLWSLELGDFLTWIHACRSIFGKASWTWTLPTKRRRFFFQLQHLYMKNTLWTLFPWNFTAFLTVFIAMFFSMTGVKLLFSPVLQILRAMAKNSAKIFSPIIQLHALLLFLLLLLYQDGSVMNLTDTYPAAIFHKIIVWEALNSASSEERGVGILKEDAQRTSKKVDMRV